MENEQYLPMHTRTDDDFLKEQERDRVWIMGKIVKKEVQKEQQRHNLQDLLRQTTKQTFPFSVIVEGSYPELDHATLWCWNQLGPRQGKCEEQHSEYPGCPQIRNQPNFKDGEPTYQSTEHHHEGIWQTIFLGKTGYDYGNKEFFFQNQQDCQNFIEAVPTIGFGPAYD